MCDRFLAPQIHEQPDIVADCAICGEEVYDYELDMCDCGMDVHKDCEPDCKTCLYAKRGRE